MKRLLLLLFAVCAACLHAGSQSYMFKRMEVKDGLPSNQINSIYKDSEGFMWFGTVSGLTRYDGYGFKTYRGSGDPASLPDDFVEKITEDAEGRLWMRTGEAGYVFFDRNTGGFVRDVAPYLRGIGVEGEVFLLHVDASGSSWFYVPYRGIYRHRPGAARAEELLLGGVLPEGEVTALADYGGKLLLAYNNGRLVCVDMLRLEVEWDLQDVSRELAGGRPEVFSLFVDADGDVWMYGVPGLWLYSLVERRWKPLPYGEGRRMPHNMVRSVAQDRDGRIWIGKDLEGIDVYDKKTGGITRLENRAGDERSLPNNTVTTLYRDGSGVMWVGTYKKGVACYDESIYKFGLTPLGDVTFIEQAKDGALWLGINDEGLMRWNPADGGRQQFGHQGEASLTANVIISLLQARDGRLWIGTFWGGLDCYDGYRFTHYRHREGDANSLADNNVWTLAEDGEGNIWIGTLGGGIQRLDPRTGTFTTYTAASCGIASDYIASICMARNNRLIVGTASSGISILDLKTGRATNLAGTPACRHRLSSQSINQVYEDSRGLIWIATRAGLNLYDEAGGSMQLVSFPQGIANPFISGIAEDHNHNLWVSTSAGVVNIVLQKGAEGYGFDFHLYDNRDGLQGSGFNQRAIKCLDSGEIAMGGLYGLNVFHPDGIKYNRTLPKVLFTGLRLFNEEVEIGKEYDGGVVLEKSLNQAGEVVLRYKQNVFTVLFASDSYVLPEKTTYYYKLEGFDEEWLASPSEVHRATYTNLAPGKYLLRVKAVNSDGLAGTEEAVLKIAILPPFWRTTWAYIGYALLFVGALLLAFYAVHRRERNRFRLRQLEEDAKKKEELNQMKFRFFTNVSHELRTPLTLILSPLESMMREAEDGQQKRRLGLMHRNAQRLLMLVNQLLDFRKIEMAGMHLTLSEGDLVSYVRNICNSFLMLSERKHVRLTFSSAMEYLNMSFDEDKIGKVVMNLLSNAFKFTPEGGRVDVTVELHPQVSGRVLVKVADTGIGIRDEDKRHIFERFYQVEQEELARQSTGSGIGLSLVYDFVTLHGGTVRVEDNTGAGSVFIVELPVRQVPQAAAVQAQPEGIALPCGTEAPEHGELLSSGAEEESLPEEEPLPEEGGGAQPEEGKAAADKPLVLIVDDNEDLVAFMEESLNLYYRVKPAANGRLAWQMIPDLMPDLIVSDVMMPEMDGNELCRRVKSDKRTKHIPLILLTAKQAVEDKVEGLTIGADDYVTKPFNMEVLVLRIRKLMELSRRDKGRRQIDPEPSKIEITSLDEQLVANGIKYVEENMARPELSVEELSQAMGMSRVHLYKKLLQITGKSPTEFIRIIRLKRAAQLLRESQLNVSEIAYRVGFNNPKYFSKYFKDEFGISPSVYQEREEK